METIDIKLPNELTKSFEKGKPIVLLGANGAGKTRLSVKIEELNDQNFMHSYSSQSFLVQRITAQKSLTLSESTIIKGLEAAEREAITGADYVNSTKLGYRFGSNPATYLLNDYDKVLSLFFARNNKLVEQYHELCREAQSKNNPIPQPIKSLKEQAEEIWSYLLPKRQIDLSGNEVHVKYNTERYHGKEMSDGERVILYMIVQALSVKENSLLIIDEPELHIHKAILKKLWDKLEEARQDCVFLYITHDLEFAVSRSVKEVLWVKSYNGNEEWDFEFLELSDYNELPEGLLFEVLGTQKKIVFVEGTRDSLDYLIFQEIYKDKDYHVIPCGGCTQVINYVKAKNGYSKFDYLKVYGIIDRDFRTPREINALERQGIFALKVAEVENLFIVPELLEFVNDRLGRNDNDLEKVKAFVVDLYDKVKHQQILSAFASEMKFRLKSLNVDVGMDADNVKTLIEEKFTKESIDSLFNDRSSVFIDLNEYESILKVFNYKELSDKIAPKFGLTTGEYRKLIINLLKRSVNGHEKEKIINAIRPYIPDLPSLEGNQ